MALKAITDILSSLNSVSLNPTNFTINGRADKFGDIQRTFMWNMLIPNISDVAPSALLDAEDLLVRCRSFAIPQRANEPITSSFMGTRQFFPGKADPGAGTITASFEDTEDMAIARIFYEWQQHIFNINPNSRTHAGKSMKSAKKNLVKDIYLIMYRYDGSPSGEGVLGTYIKFHNAWVQQVGESALSYEDSSSVKYDVTFQYDYWTQFPATTDIL